MDEGLEFAPLQGQLDQFVGATGVHKNGCSQGIIETEKKDITFFDFLYHISLSEISEIFTKYHTKFQTDMIHISWIQFFYHFWYLLTLKNL